LANAAIRLSCVVGSGAAVDHEARVGPAVPLPLRSSTIAFRNLGWSRSRRTSARSRPPRRPGCPHRKPLCTRSGFRSGCRLTAEQILLLSQLGSVQAHTASNARLSGFDYKGQLAEIA
jgi:hypothetical protein